MKLPDANDLRRRHESKAERRRKAVARQLDDLARKILTADKEGKREICSLTPMTETIEALRSANYVVTEYCAAGMGDMDSVTISWAEYTDTEKAEFAKKLVVENPGYIEHDEKWITLQGDPGNCEASSCTVENWFQAARHLDIDLPFYTGDK